MKLIRTKIEVSGADSFFNGFAHSVEAYTYTINLVNGNAWQCWTIYFGQRNISSI